MPSFDQQSRIFIRINRRSTDNPDSQLSQQFRIAVEINYTDLQMNFHFCENLTIFYLECVALFHCGELLANH
jgi:hypothetical protein